MIAKSQWKVWLVQSTDQSPKKGFSEPEHVEHSSCIVQPEVQQEKITEEEPRKMSRHKRSPRYSNGRGGRFGGNRRGMSSARLSMIEELEESD